MNLPSIRERLGGSTFHREVPLDGSDIAIENPDKRLLRLHRFESIDSGGNPANRINEMKVVHRVAGRLRLQFPCGSDLEKIEHQLARGLTPLGVVTNANSRTGRLLLRGPVNLDLQKIVEQLLTLNETAVLPGVDFQQEQRVSQSGAGAASLASEKEEEKDQVILSYSRRRSKTPPSTYRAAAKMLLPQVARFFIRGWITPPFLHPFTLAYDAWPFLKAGWRDLIRGRLSVATLDAAAIAGSVATSDQGTARTITFLLGLGEDLEEWTQEQTQQNLARMYPQVAGMAWVIQNGKEERVSADQLQLGDRVVVRAGSQIPVDGRVVDGEALVNRSSMTGESRPVRCYPSISVHAGTTIQEGHLTIEATAVGEETRIANIARLLEETTASEAQISRETERTAERIVPYTFVLAAVVLLLTRSWRRALSVLVVDFSCALKLNTPLTIKSAMIEASAHGALFKSGSSIEALAKTDVFVFDKTGTLTRAAPRVCDVHPFGDFSRTFVLRNAACLEEHFPHPVASAVVRQAEQEQLHHDESHAEVEYVAAHGIASVLDGERILVGSRHFVCEDEGIDVDQATPLLDRFAARGHSALFVAIGGKLAGLIELEDPIIEGADEIIRQVRQLGAKRVLLLTGDNPRSARSVARRLDIEEVHAEVLPDDKLQLIRKLQQEGHTVAMIGDGMNDSAALAHADIGISVQHGADIAREACGLLLLDRHIFALPDALKISQAAMGRVKRSFFGTVGANALFMILGVFNLTPATLLALAHNSTTVVSALLSLRPLIYHREKK